MPLGDTNQYDCWKAQQQLMTIQLMSSVDSLESYKIKTKEKYHLCTQDLCGKVWNKSHKNEMWHKVLGLKN